ncbi:WD40 repeat domain-containing protein [Trichocoleus sp. FACHB-262]|uniref:WD40 repeat domain-containing protein n=1 Tax=Trichocoleus sp. FACHB-262 TaxID=2692869 RepID=UPI001684E34E|nr:WD40 repeat domain-containing protein [Trichocoleus sp. FACHB-262]MBD2122366.1 hypothetical protein [Trichocoleus sp. FACHB-262]
MPFQLRYTLKTLKFEQPIGLYPDGTAIVGVQEKRIIGTWEVSTGKLIQTLELQGNPQQIQISQDGQTAIVRYGKTGSLDRVAIWDIPSQQMLGEIQCGCYQFDNQSLSADRHTIVGRVSYLGQVMVWHLPDGKPFCTFDMPARITCVAINSTGQIVVAGNETYEGGAVKVWDLVSNTELHSLSVIHYIPTGYNPHSEGCSDEPQGVADIWLSADAKLLLCKILRNETQIWDLQRGQRLKALPPGMPTIPNFPVGGYFSYRDRRVAISQDGGLLATTSQDGSLVLRNLKTNETFSPFAGHTDEIYALVLSPDGKTFITHSRDNTAKIWNLASGEQLHTLTSACGYSRYFSRMSLALTPAIVNLPLTLFVLENGGIGIWDVASRRKIQSLKHEQFSSYECLTISAEGQWLASGGGNHRIHIWNWQQGKLLQSFQHDPELGKRTHIINLVFSSRYECLISTAQTGSIKFWNWLTGQPLSSPLLPASAQGDRIALSPDERLLAAADLHVITIWNLETGKVVHTLPNAQSCTAMAFSPDGRLLAAGYSKAHDGRIYHTIKLWDVATGQVLQQLKEHPLMVTGLVFSPDGQLISCSEDTSICVWQLAND